MSKQSLEEASHQMQLIISSSIEDGKTLGDNKCIVAYDTSKSEDNSTRILDSIRQYITDSLSQSVHLVNDRKCAENEILKVMNNEDKVDLIFARSESLIIKRLQASDKGEV